jgi:heat shock protein HslJ
VTRSVLAIAWMALAVTAFGCAVVSSTSSAPSAVVARDAAGPPKDSLDGAWRLVELGDASLLSLDRVPSLEFDVETGLVSGHTGCNRLSGSFTIGDSGALGLSELATTRMACAGPSIESQFLAALAAVERCRVAAATLELTDARGHVIARFDRESGVGD